MTTGDSTPKWILKSNQCHTRQLKVREGFHDYQLKQKPEQRTEVGWVELKGHWLIEAGFKPHQPVTVRVMQGCLVLTLTPQPEGLFKKILNLKHREKAVIRDLVEELRKKT